MKTYLKPDEIRQIAEAVVSKRDRLLILYLFHIVCRISEALPVGVLSFLFILK